MINRILFGQTAAGAEAEGFSMRNAAGMEVHSTSYGCRLMRILLPEAGGTRCDVLLGYDNLVDYEADEAEHGAFVGRHAGRIAHASFELGEQTYQLTKNAGDDFIHGSFSHKLFQPQILGDNSVSYTYTSPAGEDGFPGEIWVAVTYTLTDKNELVMDYRAVSDADTYLNLTNHSYFNLAGTGTIEDHTLVLPASHFIEAGADLLPTGRLPAVAGGAFDFLHEKPIGRDIDAADPQLQLAGGYDHGFMINRQTPAQLALAAAVRHKPSGRGLKVYTSEPEVHLYTGQGLSGIGKQGRPMGPRSGFCLECQHPPDSPHQPDFPTTLLEARTKYHQSTILQFEF